LHMDVFPNYFCMCLYDKLISKILLVIISIRDITYTCKCNLKHDYFHSKKNKQKNTVYEQFVRLYTST